METGSIFTATDGPRPLRSKLAECRMHTLLYAPPSRFPKQMRPHRFIRRQIRPTEQMIWNSHHILRNLGHSQLP